MARLLPGLLSIGAAVAVTTGSVAAQVQTSPGARMAAAAGPGAVAGAPPPAEVLPSRPIYGTAFGLAALRDLPSSPSAWSLIETAAPMIVVDRIENGGLYLGEPPHFGSYGSSWTQATISVDGIDVTDPERTGTALMVPDPQLLAGVAAFSALLPADAAGPGPVVAFALRRPGDAWAGTLRASVLPRALQAIRTDSDVPSVARFASANDAGLLVSGPVVPGRFGLLLSGRFAASRRFERADPMPLDNRVSSLLVRGVVTPAPDSLFRFVASIDVTGRPFDGRARFANRDARSRDTFLHVHGAWDRLVKKAWAWSVAVAYQRGRFTTPDVPSTPSVATIERLSDGPVAELMLPTDATRDRVDALARFEWTPGGVTGKHRLRGGVSVDRASARTNAMPAADIGEMVDGLPARVWSYSFAGPTRRSATNLAAWMDARVALASRISLDVSARYEATRGRSDGGARIGWDTVLPRAVLRWALTESGRVAAFAGYGWYRHRLPLGYLAFGDAAGLSGQVARWNDVNRDGVVQPGEHGALVSVVGPGGGLSAIDPNLKAPVTDELAIGFQAGLGRRWQLRVGAMDRRARSLVAPINVGVTVADYSVIRLWDIAADELDPADDRDLLVYNRNPSSFGRDRYLLTHPAGNDARYRGIDVAFERVFDGRWHMLIGATAHTSDGMAGNRGFLVTENDPGVLGEAFLDPNALTWNRGRLFFDRGYVVKWSGGAVLPRDFYLGAVARYQDGQHFTRMAIVPDLNQGPEAIQAYTRGLSRFTYTFTLDARVEKGFRLGSRRVAFVLEGFNLLNTANEVEEVAVVTRNNFRASTALEPPRAFRLGFRVDF